MGTIQETTLIDLLQHYKKGNMEEQRKYLLEIIGIMKPAIRKYANKVPIDDRDDIEQELCIAIIESLPGMEIGENDGQCINYLYTAIRYRFCKWYRNQQRVQQEMDSDVQQMLLQEKESVDEYENIDFGVDLIRLLKCSSELHKKILMKIVTAEATDIEIATELNISRQYVNRCKKDIFRKLPDYVKR